LHLDRAEVSTMVCRIHRSACACIGLVTILAWPAASRAEDGAPATASQGVTITRTLEPNGAVVVERWPDRAPAESPSPAIGTGGTLLLSGVVTFGLSYVPAVMTASESTFAIDKQLYIPIAGPWLDLASRPNCGVGSLSCNAETGNQALLVVDGVVQGLAVIQVLAGLGAVAHDTATAVAKSDDKPTVHVRPTRLAAGGYGLAAIGKF
jgi:hypothetical protein